ncbi:RNA-directed DNA polymerase, eukaryota, Reverse transcriptase zinc-binding domain protein [Artemisia annua]|uniref:RNA-directed DNA polymerase, eukaryota, Reverse transcriptase zinc-binding domain protein n=1 Tax=Artemisia annua TaxID=35608 RepID=A0A2U1N0W7_ARTAN|nr:RNA-directed DNA polymerase, eukaryota, Reverse transcriptase zinc-binding domain protein [Artemisia annua]
MNVTSAASDNSGINEQQGSDNIPDDSFGSGLNDVVKGHAIVNDNSIDKQNNNESDPNVTELNANEGEANKEKANEASQSVPNASVASGLDNVNEGSQSCPNSSVSSGLGSTKPCSTYNHGSSSVSFADKLKNSSVKKVVKVSELRNNELKQVEQVVVEDDGFVQVNSKKGKGKQQGKKQIDGIRFQKPKPKMFYYRPVNKSNADIASTSKSNNPNDAVKGNNSVATSKGAQSDVNEGVKHTKQPTTVSQVQLSNSFDALQDEDSGEQVGKEESHVATSRLEGLCKKVFRNWEWTSNGHLCVKSSRIILGWNHEEVDLNVVNMDDQVIHTCIRFKVDKRELFCSFIYAHNRYIHRRPLWHNLCVHKHYVRNRPWCLLGDFNSALHLEDKLEGSSIIDIAMREFQECVNEIEVCDVNRSGLQFTWNQKPRGSDGTLKKIDRIMANLECTDGFVGAHAIFQPYRISDHSPAILTIPTAHKFQPRPFKFFNILVQKPRFKTLVKELWDVEVRGFHMYRVASKLKSLKKPLRKLLFDEGNIHDKAVYDLWKSGNFVNDNSNLESQNMGSQAAVDKDSNAQGTMNKHGSINQESSLLADAPILRSILKKAVRNVPGKDKTTSMSSVTTNVSRQQGDVDEVPLMGGIAAKVQNLDGKILGRDGNVLKQSRMVHFADQVEVLPTEQHKYEVAGNGMSSGVGKAALGTPTQVAQAATIQFFGKEPTKRDIVKSKRLRSGADVITPISTEVVRKTVKCLYLRLNNRVW